MLRFFLAGCLAVSLAAEPMPQPRFTADNQLLIPQGYREWIFVGANFGMGYSELPPGQVAAKPGKFHNIYIQRQAFDHFARTGAFPDKTMLVMEIVQPATNASINRQGVFQDRYVGIEVAVKDEQRFPGKWAYFAFFDSEGKQLPQAKAFPKKACWDCHNQHGAVDNVFVQFYPVLRAARSH